MSLNYLMDPNIQLQDKSGNNNVNGFLRVYIDNTDDRAVTYKDFNGTFNKADIRLDNNGRAVVIVDDTMTYRLEVYDRDGAMLWTQYPVKPSNTVINYGINNTYVMNADVRGTPDEIDVASTIDPQTGFKTFFIKLSSTVKNFFDYVSNTLTSHGDSIGNLQNGKKNKQQPKSFNGSATKTVKKVTQNSDGEMSVEFEDIDLPPEVPNVEITSPNRTINVHSSTNVQTNTKTFSIDVNHKPLSIGGFTASMSVVNWNFRAQQFTLGNIGLQGDKIGYNSTTQYISLAVGTYELSARYIVTWSGTPQNKVVYIGNVPFDLSYNHSQEIDRTYVTKLSRPLSSLILILQTSEEPPTGLTCELSALYIHSLEQVLENAVQGLQSVSTDETLTGDGTTEHPLSVIVDNVLDADSENPVQNKVLYGIIGDVETLLGDL